MSDSAGSCLLGELRPRIQLVPFEEINLSTKRRYLIKGVIPRGGLVVIWGPPGSGKSLWTFDALMHVALGWEYRGRRVSQGAVVYCAFEGNSGIDARVEAFRQRFLAEETGPVSFFLQMLTLDLVADHQALIGAIRSQLSEPPVAIVLDTLNQSLAGSESSDEDMTAYVRATSGLRQAFGSTVAVVHHCGVERSRPRGHTALTGAADMQIAIRRDAADNIVAEIDKARDGPKGIEIVNRLELVEVGLDEDNDLITSCVIVPAEGDGVPEVAKVTGAAKIALDLLRKAIDEAGEPAPKSPQFAGASRTIPVSLWRSYCDTGMVAKSDKPDSRLKAFVRAVERLQSLTLIRVWADRVWLVEPSRTSRT